MNGRCREPGLMDTHVKLSIKVKKHRGLARATPCPPSFLIILLFKFHFPLWGQPG